MRHAGLVRSQRGAEGGYWLARPANEISVADVLRAVEGPLASVRGERPEDIEYPEGAASLQRAWISVRASVRSIAENVSLADLAAGKRPAAVEKLAADPGQRRSPARARAPYAIGSPTAAPLVSRTYTMSPAESSSCSASALVS